MPSSAKKSGPLHAQKSVKSTPELPTGDPAVDSHLTESRESIYGGDSDRSISTPPLKNPPSIQNRRHSADPKRKKGSSNSFMEHLHRITGEALTIDTLASGSIRPAHTLTPVSLTLLGTPNMSSELLNTSANGLGRIYNGAIFGESDFYSPLNESQPDSTASAGEGGEHHESSSEEGDNERIQAPLVGGYDPQEFVDITNDEEVTELFSYIEAYHAQSIEVEPILKPFVLDFVPAVGDIDAFIKIPRPDEIEDNLGLIVLDEPCAKQSDPTVLDMHLRAVTKTSNVPKEAAVKRLDRADKKSREIEQWIASIGELHKTKPATTVHFSRPMPDIETLMQEWPADFEESLRGTELPSADMELSLAEYVDVVCAMLDIPVHKSRIQSLYQLFSLYLEFKDSHHFKQMVDDTQGEAQEPVPRSDDAPETIQTSTGKRTDRLEL